jgi:hypothetical protein
MQIKKFLNYIVSPIIPLITVLAKKKSAHNKKFILREHLFNF